MKLLFWLGLWSFGQVYAQDCLQYMKQRSWRKKEVILVFVPGAGARDYKLNLGHLGWGKYFSQVESLVKQKGINYSLVPADPKGNESLGEREIRLMQWLWRPEFKNKKILLIGHSLGGIVARNVARRSQGVVIGVLSFATPFKGTPLVDWLQENPGAQWPLRQIATAAGYNPKDKRYFDELAVDYRIGWRSPGLKIPFFNFVSGPPKRDLIRSLPVFAVTSKVIQEQLNKMGLPLGRWGMQNDGIVPSFSQIDRHSSCWQHIPLHHGAIIGKTTSRQDLILFEKQWNSILEALVRP